MSISLIFWLSLVYQDALRQDDSPHGAKIPFISVIAPVYFVVFVLMAQFVLVNVVVAVLMKKLEVIIDILNSGIWNSLRFPRNHISWWLMILKWKKKFEENWQQIEMSLTLSQLPMVMIKWVLYVSHFLEGNPKCFLCMLAVCFKWSETAFICASQVSYWLLVITSNQRKTMWVVL